MQISSLVVGPIETNCYLLADETADNAAAVIDPGDEAERIVEHIRHNNLRPVCILLTHGHPDHVSGIAGVLEAFPGLPIYVHKNDRELAVRKGRLDECGASALLRLYEDGDTVEVGSLRLQVLLTPGHTPGSVCLKLEDQVLFTGDTLFEGSCGRTDFPGGSMDQMMDSLFRLGKLGGAFAVYPGHGPSTTMEREFRSNYYLLSALRESVEDRKEADEQP